MDIDAAASSHEDLVPLVDVSSSEGCSIYSESENKEVISKKVFNFCSVMYSIPSMPLSHCQSIFTSAFLVEGINNAYKQKIMSLCESNADKSNANLILDLDEMFNFVESTMQSYRRCYRVEKILKEKGFFIPPISRTLGYVKKRMEFKKKLLFLMRTYPECMYLFQKY